MGKVMTGDGTVTNITNHVSKEQKESNKDHKPAAAVSDPAHIPVVEVEKTETPAVDPKADSKAPLDEGLEPEDADLTERVRKKIAKKHRQWKEAEAAAQEAERFAENQYNERSLLQKRADALEAELAQLRTQAQSTPKQDELKEPDERDPKFFNEKGEFEWKKFAKALSQYETRKALAEAEESRKQERSAKERQEKEDAIRASTQKAREQFPDFDEVMSAVSGTEADQVPQFVLNYLGETENAGLVAYHLAKHPEEALRISKLKPILGLAELGKLEDKLATAAAPPKKTESAPVTAPIQRGGAPAPITPIDSGQAPVIKDPSRMNYKELRAFERERMRR